MYLHQVTVQVATHQPKDAKMLQQEIKAALGPWCDYAKAISLNVPDRAANATIKEEAECD